jgi:hypothetical protein
MLSSKWEPLLNQAEGLKLLLLRKNGNWAEFPQAEEMHGPWIVNLP